MSIPIRREGGIDDPLSYSPHGADHSAPVASELSPNASPTVPRFVDAAARLMAPGVGGFNIDPPAPSASPAEGDVASEDTQGVVPGPRIAAPNIALTPPRARPVEGDVASEDTRAVVPECVSDCP
jgi:hypothetical protein